MSHINRQLTSINELADLGYEFYNADRPLTSRLSNLLREKGLNANDLSRLTGISRQSISLVVKNKAVPNTEFALKVATVLNVSVFDLFSLEPHAWCSVAKEKDKTLYFDHRELKIVGVTAKQEAEQIGRQWVNLETRQTSLQQNEEFARPRFEKLVKRVQPVALAY